MPSNPRSPKQANERSYLASMPELWRALSDGTRDAWRGFAEAPEQELKNQLGESYYASGYNWFCKCNLRLLRVGRTTRTGIPTLPRPAAPAIDGFRVCETGTESDLCVGGVASASTEDPSYPAAKAFDGLTSWPNIWQATWGITTGWLQYVLTAPANVKHLRIYIDDKTSTMRPYDWTFEVYDGAAFQVLLTVTSWTPATDGWHDFYFENSYNKSTYKLNITANAGHASGLRVWELDFLYGEVTSVIIYPEDEFSLPTTHDLILHVSMGASIGMEVQYPGYREILAIQNAGRHQETFQAEAESTFGTIMPSRSWFAQLHRQTSEGLRSAAQTAKTFTEGS